MSQNQKDNQSEAEIERRILRVLGPTPKLLLCKNEVSRGFQGSLLPALHSALAPFGPEVVAAAVNATQRHRATFGLGVGSPDLVGALNGRALGLELKTAIGRLSPEQERWHRAARLRGAAVMVVRSVEEATAALERAAAGSLE